MKKLKSQKGFGAIEILLVLVILGMIGGIGYYVYKANQSEPKVSDFSIPKQKQKTEVQDETSAWLEVESLNKEFSLRIPDGWKLNNDSTRDLVISGLDPDDITYKEGEVPIVTNEETPISDAPHRFSVNILDNPDQTEGTETEFILTNGQKGTKILTEFEDLVNGAGLIKSATYQFEKVGKFYVVNYSRLPGDPDNTTMVEKVIKTLQF